MCVCVLPPFLCPTPSSALQQPHFNVMTQAKHVQMKRIPACKCFLLLACWSKAFFECACIHLRWKMLISLKKSEESTEGQKEGRPSRIWNSSDRVHNNTPPWSGWLIFLTCMTWNMDVQWCTALPHWTGLLSTHACSSCDPWQNKRVPNRHKHTSR